MEKFILQLLETLLIQIKEEFKMEDKIFLRKIRLYSEQGGHMVKVPCEIDMISYFPIAEYVIKDGEKDYGALSILGLELLLESAAKSDEFRKERAEKIRKNYEKYHDMTSLYITLLLKSYGVSYEEIKEKKERTNSSYEQTVNKFLGDIHEGKRELIKREEGPSSYRVLTKQQANFGPKFMNRHFRRR